MLATPPNRETLLQIAQQLPASAQVLAQLGNLLTDVNSGLDDIARLLRRDSNLAARIIRISNSVMFGVGAQIATIEEAVNRVGYAEIYRLTGLAAAAELANHPLSFYGITGMQLRDNTLIVALAAEALAMRGGANSRVAYTAALMRSTGKQTLDRYAKKYAATCPPFFSSGSAQIELWEQNNFATTNAEVAFAVLTAWRFPIEITEPVRHQLSNTSAHSPASQTALVLQIARALACEAGFGLIGENNPGETNDSTLSQLDLTPSLVDECGEEALASFHALQGLL